jgi:hypothetical protein
METCAVDFCRRPKRKVGYCDSHYAAMRRGRPFRQLDPTPEERFFSHVTQDGSDCWLWDGMTDADGYGKFRPDRGVTPVSVTGAHRWAFEYLRAEIPPGLDIDHLCRVRNCVNPWHLEPVPTGVNTLRGNSYSGVNLRKTHCIHGHEFTDTNTRVRINGSRVCRACERSRYPLRWRDSA